MKRSINKLSLNKLTISNLDSYTMGQMIGGGTINGGPIFADKKSAPAICMPPLTKNCPSTAPATCSVCNCTVKL